MKSFHENFETMLSGIRQARETRTHEAACRTAWLAQFGEESHRAREERFRKLQEMVQTSRRQRAIQLSEITSHTSHLLGRFRMERAENQAGMKDALGDCGRKRALELSGLMGQFARTRHGWRHELDRAHAALEHFSHSQNAAGPASAGEAPSSRSRPASHHAAAARPAGDRAKGGRK